MHPTLPTYTMNKLIGYEIIGNKCQLKDNHVDLIGRNEHLREDLAAILDIVGEEFDINTIKTKEKQRVSSKSWKDLCKYPPGLEDKIIEANLPFAKTFGLHKIKNFTLYGERNSGTNLIERLI